MTRTQAACTGLAVLLLSVSACLGTQARESVQSAALSLDTAQYHLEVGISAGLVRQELSTDEADLLQSQFAAVRSAIEADRREFLLGLPIDELRRWADRGIDERMIAGDFGPNTANSKRNRLRLFFDLIERMAP